MARSEESSAEKGGAETKEVTTEKYRPWVLRRLIRHLKGRRAVLAKMRHSTCEFCASENVPINDEHVFPLWLSVPVLARMNAPRVRSVKGSDVIYETKTVEALHVTVQAACKLTCNNGWMNRLETRCSEFLKPMILEGTATPLNDERQVLLSAWAVKTAMTHEFVEADASRRYFRREERTHLKTWLRPPDDVWVWVGHSARVKQLGSDPFIAAKKGVIPRNVSVFAIAFWLGQLWIQVLAFRRREWQDGQVFKLETDRFRDHVQLLWPRRTSEILLWPPKAAVDEDQIPDFLGRFFDRAPSLGNSPPFVIGNPPS